MNDIEYMFNKEIYDRKRVGRGAYAKINGSKSRKCSLPHDGLSEAKLRKLNGPCLTVRMDKPCTWEMLKAMPTDLAGDYLHRLKGTYRVGMKEIAEMLGCGKSTLGNWMCDKGIRFTKKSPHPTEADLAAWARFCSGEEAFETDVADLGEDETTDETAEEAKFEETPAPNRRVEVKSGAVTAVGGGAQLAEHLYSLLGDRMAEITVQYRFVGGAEGDNE